MPHVEPPRLPALRLGWSRARRRDGDSRNSVADEGRLFVRTKWKGEPEHLLQTARTRRVAPLFVGNSCAQRLDQAGSGRTSGVSAEDEPRRTGARDGIEVDHGEDVLASARLGGEVRRAAGAFGGTVCREEHE